MRPVYRFYAISKTAFILLCAAFFIGGCARKAPEQRIAEFSQKQFILTDELGVKSRALISKISPANGEESRYKLVWLDMLGAPIARKILSIKGGEAKFRNDGFLPPDSQSERVFLALLENADKPNFTVNAKGRRYDAVSK
ncbi:hypothetical protein [uncultured Campylobacter sp.]|uniref:hypothetical protein n=1 Tax=uncultured Campylobacter sp. TaxID=218934 RepID=UPI00261F13D9|nr:hypothetical protein [uncultured Campylobacter sp.]